MAQAFNKLETKHMSQEQGTKVSVPIADFPGFLLRMATAAAMSRLTNSLAELDLRIPEASILVVIHANPGCPQNEIGRALNIVSANLTPILHRLEKRGLVKRTPIDGRTNAIDLTHEGILTVMAALAKMRAFEAEIIDAVAPLDEREFTAALKRLTSVFSH
jgi:DNA-binding MarR family transcriptional regulator